MCWFPFFEDKVVYVILQVGLQSDEFCVIKNDVGYFSLKMESVNKYNYIT